MRKGGYNLGGERSGHIVRGDYGTTGDGLVAALQVLAVLVAEGGWASEVCRRFDPYPRQLTNVRVSGGRPLEDARVKKAIQDGEARLAGTGRLLIRPSGTEPVVRVMAEGEDEALIAAIVGNVAEAIEQAESGAM